MMGLYYSFIKFLKPSKVGCRNSCLKRFLGTHTIVFNIVCYKNIGSSLKSPAWKFPLGSLVLFGKKLKRVTLLWKGAGDILKATSEKGFPRAFLPTNSNRCTPGLKCLNHWMGQNSCIHSFAKYFLNLSYVPCSVLGSGDIRLTKQWKNHKWVKNRYSQKGCMLSGRL